MYVTLTSSLLALQPTLLQVMTAAPRLVTLVRMTLAAGLATTRIAVTVAARLVILMRMIPAAGLATTRIAVTVAVIPPPQIRAAPPPVRPATPIRVAPHPAPQVMAVATVLAGPPVTLRSTSVALLLVMTQAILQGQFLPWG